MKDAVYFDYAAATPLDRAVEAAMQPYFRERFYNPSAVYLASRGVADDIKRFRTSVAHWLGCRPSEIVFTAGATEANNLAIRGILDTHPGAHVLASSIEHEAVLQPLAKHEHDSVGVDVRGMVSLRELGQKISDNTVLVTSMYANNEIGTIQHLSDISHLIAEVRAKRKSSGNELPLYFHSDASQAANYLDLHVDKLGVDLMTINSGKMYGPKQSGFLYVRAGVDLAAQIGGGGQERGLRSGTENVAAIAGLATALELAQGSRKEESLRLEQLSRELCEVISKAANKAEFLGHKKHRLPNITSVLIPGIDGERVVMMLDEVGIQVATGSACSAQSDESSHVIKALGKTEAEARTSLRFSLGRGSQAADIQRLDEVFGDIIQQARTF